MELLTVAEAAAVLNVKERFVRQLITERRVDVIHLGRLVRIERTVLEAYVRAGTVPARAAGGRRRVGMVA